MAVDDSLTKVLLHFNGGNAGTIFTDESAKVWTSNGVAQISTGQFQYGGAAGSFSGAIQGTNFISTPDNDDFDFGNGAWTIDFWAYRTGTSGTDQIFCDNRGTSGTGWVFFVDNTYRLDSYTDGALRANSGTWTLTQNAWNHVAYQRSTDDIVVYLNGTARGTAALSAGSSMQAAVGSLRIGARFDGTLGFAGYIDEFRLSKGVARYTTSTFPLLAGEYGAFGLDLTSKMW